MRYGSREWRVRYPSIDAPQGTGCASKPEPVADVVREGDVTTVVLQGEIDLSNAWAVREIIEEECARHPAKLVVDLDAVEFVDSSALNLFVTTHRTLLAEGCLLVLASPSEQVWRSFVITHLDGTLLFEKTPARNVS